jgi:pyridoxal phosphate enzyme (YggS family)
VTTLAERIAEVQARVATAARRTGRDPADVLLVAISKTVGPEKIAAAYEAGLRHFGENRVEEAQSKIALLRADLPGIIWHMVGHIQSRKAPDVAECFDWVHSVERLKVARRLAETARAMGRVLPVLLEVNASGEETKDGFELARWPDDTGHLAAFYAEVEAILALPGLAVRGLMTMAPYTEQPETVRPVFRRVRQLRDALRERFTSVDWAHLSMGMTADFEVAIEEGATLVRVGTAVFGPRQ